MPIMTEDGSIKSAIEEFNEDLERVKPVKIEGDYVIITHSRGVEYDIEKSRCASHAKILGWVRHLSDKCWFTQEMCRLFIDMACEINGIGKQFRHL